MKNITYTISKRKAFNICKSVLNNLNYYDLVEDFDSGIIETSKDGNVFSYGNKVTIEIENNTVNIKSRSKGIQLIDWGINSQNENILAEQIIEYLK